MNKNQHGRGFILFIGEHRKISQKIHSYYKTFKEEKNFSLFFERDGNKNFKVKETSSHILIYLGDRHFDRNDEKLPITSETFNSEMTGISITVEKSSGIAQVYSDFLGTELVYYSKNDCCVVLSDRLDNFTAYDSSYKPNLTGVYSYLSGVFTVGESTLLENVYQLRPLQSLKVNPKTLDIKKSEEKLWLTKDGADVDKVYEEVNERMFEVLRNAPDSNLMLSAGWDSRVLLSSNLERILSTYTHGDIASREVKIAFELGRDKNLNMFFSPLESTNFSAHSIRESLAELGQIIFPHWYQAGLHAKKLNGAPLTAGLGVEVFSGHYGINSLSTGGDKLRKLASSMLNPRQFDKLNDQDAIDYLLPFLSSGFGEKTWFFSSEVNGKILKQNHRDSVETILDGYIASGTSGSQEICERFKLEHQSRQFYALQTKSASYSVGYFHPYTDSKLNQILLKLKYRDRVNYKVSQYVVSNRDTSLLEQPLAATLTKASRPVVVQEASRIVRASTERITTLRNRKITKGLGWNNFQFLYDTNLFHDYIDMLSDSEYWDKDKMHRFVQTYTKQKREAYSLLEMLMKIITVDYRLNPNHFL